AAALVVVALDASYICLFNPRSEGVTYAMPALPWALLIAVLFSECRNRALWTLAAAILFLMGCTALTPGMIEITKYWSKPTMFIGFLALTGYAFMWRKGEL